MGSTPTSYYKSKRLLPSQVKSVLIPDRKESGHEEVRKTNRVGIRVVQFRGLAASLRSKSSRVDCDAKCG